MSSKLFSYHATIMIYTVLFVSACGNNSGQNNHTTVSSNKAIGSPSVGVNSEDNSKLFIEQWKMLALTHAKDVFNDLNDHNDPYRYQRDAIIVSLFECGLIDEALDLALSGNSKWPSHGLETKLGANLMASCGLETAMNVYTLCEPHMPETSKQSYIYSVASIAPLHGNLKGAWQLSTRMNDPDLVRSIHIFISAATKRQVGVPYKTADQLEDMSESERNEYLDRVEHNLIKEFSFTDSRFARQNLRFFHHMYTGTSDPTDDYVVRCLWAPYSNEKEFIEEFTKHLLNENVLINYTEPERWLLVYAVSQVGKYDLARELLGKVSSRPWHQNTDDGRIMQRFYIAARAGDLEGVIQGMHAVKKLERESLENTYLAGMYAGIGIAESGQYKDLQAILNKIPYNTCKAGFVMGVYRVIKE